MELITKIYCNGEVLDLFDNLDLSIVYNVSDIRNPESRQSSYSKTINIPGTANNNRLFSYIFDIGKVTQSVLQFTPDFNVNKRADCIVTIDEVEIFRGFIQLTKINLTGSDSSISYDITLYSNIADLYSAWGDLELTDLDLSPYDHVYNRTNIVANWNNTWDNSAICYPMIDYGTNQSAPYQWQVKDWKPAVFVKQYIDLALNDAGYTTDSSFFDTDLFKRLIIPANKPTASLSQTEIQRKLFKVKTISTPNQVYTNPNNSQELIVSYNFEGYPLFDTGNNFDTSTYRREYNKPITEYFILDFSVEFDISFTQYSEVLTPPNLGDTIQSASIVAQTTSSGTREVQYKIIIRKNGVTDLFDTGILTQAYSIPTGTISHDSNVTVTFTPPTTPSTVAVTYANSTPYYDFVAGDYVEVYLYMVTDAVNDFSYNVQWPLSTDPYSSASAFDIVRHENKDSYFSNRPASGTDIAEGDTMTINSFIPENIKVRDFFSSIIKMFNLHVEVDKHNPKLLHIETYDEYYGSGSTHDWTALLDLSQPIEQIPCGDLQARKFDFTYKEDNDYYNETYKKAYLTTYGNYTNYIDNDFVKDEKKNELIFSATPAVTADNGAWVYSPIYKINSSTGLKETFTSNIRILYFAGLTATASTFRVRDTGGTYGDYTSSPQAVHFDSVSAPSLDLLWGIPQAFYYSTSAVTNNYLFNGYWSRHFAQISDKDSKLVTCYLHLRPIDIATFDFRDLIFIDGHYFFVNKINFNPLINGSYQVELLKLTSLGNFQPETSVVLPTVTTYNLNEGGENEVRDAGATSFYNLNEGSLDEVRDIGATSFFNVLNAGNNVV